MRAKTALVILGVVLAVAFAGLVGKTTGPAERAIVGVAVAATGDPVVAAAGDIACDPANASFNGGLGTSNSCRQKYTSDLLVDAGLAAVLDLGDNQYYCGGYQAFLQSYDLSWGRVKPITYPAVGNHEYLTSGGTDCNSANAGAAGHFRYFGAAAGDPSKGYYSYDIGTWHLIVLNSNCGAAGGCSSSTPQGQWLRADLAAHTNFCTLAYWHVPVFSSGGRADSAYRTFWDALYAADADVVLNGHDHTYERFAPQTPTGALDLARGIREFVVGSGGANHTSFTTIFANSQVRNDTTYGVLKLTLHPTSYDWEFVPEAGRTFSDAGTGACHGPTPDTSPPSDPSNLAANAVGGSRVDLSWTASTDDVAVAGYRILRNGSEVATSTTASYSDRTVQPNTTYTYAVRAFDHGGNLSGSSNTASATTGPPDQVLTFAPSDDAYVQADLAGTNFGSATSIHVDNSPVKNFLLKFPLSGIAGRQVVSAKLRLHCLNASDAGGDFHLATSSSWSEQTVTWNSAPAANAAVAASLGAVTAGTWYEVDLSSLVTGDGSLSLRVTSASTDGADYDSTEGTASFAPQLVVTVAGESVPDTEAPTAPTNLLATSVSSSTISLSWDASTDDVGVAGYQIVRDGLQVGTSPSTSFLDSALQPATTYTYTVRAFDAAEHVSGDSNTASATTKPPSSTVIVLPSDDATVRSSMPTTNFGTSPSLETDNQPVQHLLLKFSVSGIGTRTVVSAKLRLFCTDSSNRGGDFRVANSSWSEGTVNWNNAPAANSAVSASLGPVSVGTWYEVDVTSLVLGDGVVSLKVTSSSNNGADYASKEGAAGRAPQLVITVQ